MRSACGNAPAWSNHPIRSKQEHLRHHLSALRSGAGGKLLPGVEGDETGVEEDPSKPGSGWVITDERSPSVGVEAVGMVQARVSVSPTTVNGRSVSSNKR